MRFAQFVNAKHLLSVEGSDLLQELLALGGFTTNSLESLDAKSSTSGLGGSTPGSDFPAVSAFAGAIGGLPGDNTSAFVLLQVGSLQTALGLSPLASEDGSPLTDLGDTHGTLHAAHGFLGLHGALHLAHGFLHALTHTLGHFDGLVIKNRLW